MADFKFQNITPAVGNIKLGSSNVSKIYSGSTQVWPAEGGCSYTFANSADLGVAVDLWFSDNTEALATYGPINEWCTGNVTSMNSLFIDRTDFNDDISSWDTSSVTNMEHMFDNATSFNQDISSWDVSNVTTMQWMFYNGQIPGSFPPYAFNQDIGAWDVSSVINTRSMFVGCHSFNNGGSNSIKNWDLRNVPRASMAFMFYSTAFNQDISTWCVPDIGSEPASFSTLSPLTQSNKPIWGTCPPV